MPKNSSIQSKKHKQKKKNPMPKIRKRGHRNDKSTLLKS